MAAANNSNYQWLDLLRFAAALAVVLAHVRGFVFHEYAALVPDSRNPVITVFYAVTRLGHEAVIVFFVLSGYLVGGKAIERMIAGTFRPGDYAIDRITRIWVPLVPALVLSSFLAGNSDGIGVWLGNLLGLQGIFVRSLGGNDPLWSLAYEIWFYVLMYAVGRQAVRKNLDAFALLTMALAALVFTKLGVQYLACWLVGAVFYLKPHRLSKVSGLLISGALCAAAVAGLQLTGEGVMARTGGWPALQPGLEILLAVGAGSACVTLVTLKATRFTALAAPLAGFSYTLYLTHYPLLLALRKSGWERITVLDLRAFVIYGLVAIACLVIGWAIYWLFERNTARVRGLIKSYGAPRLANE